MPYKKPNIATSIWEDGEFVVTVNGKPVGQTLSQEEAKIVYAWLPTAIQEIYYAYTPPIEKA